MEVLLPNGYTTQVDEEIWLRKSLFLLPWYGAQHPGGKIYVIAKVRDATRPCGQRTLRLHRMILDAPAGFDVDHREGPGLDNRIENLRFCDDERNQQNTRSRGGTSRYKGVSWNKVKGRWIVRTSVGGKEIFGGYFADEDDAARRFDDLARLHHGEFARLNFPKEGEAQA